MGQSGFEPRLPSGLRKHKVRDLGQKGKAGRSWEVQGAEGSGGPRAHGAVGTGAGRRLPDLCPITSVTRAPTPGGPALTLSHQLCDSPRTRTPPPLTVCYHGALPRSPKPPRQVPPLGQHSRSPRASRLHQLKFHFLPENFQDNPALWFTGGLQHKCHSFPFQR